MNEWGFIGKDILVGIRKSATPARPEVLNLNQGVAMCERKGWYFLIPTHHSWTLNTIKYL